MRKRKKHVFLKSVSPVMAGLRMVLMLGAGVALLVFPAFVARWETVCLIVFLSVNALATLGLMLRKRGNLWHTLLSLLMLAAVLIWPKLPATAFALLFGLWTLLTAAIQLTFAWQLHKTSSKGGLFYVLFGLVSLAFALSVIVNPMRGLTSVSTLVGWYFVLYGLWIGVDLAALLCGKNFDANPVVGALRIKPPVILTAILPSRVLKRMQQEAFDASGIHVTHSPAEKTALPDSLEILFHLGEQVAMGFGHVDVVFKGVAYSYGCYDDRSNRLFGAVSDGTFMVAPGESYKTYARTFEKQMLVGYTVSLTADSAKRVHQAVNELLALCKRWTPDTTDAKPATTAHACKTLGSRYFKVQQGRFRYYNVFKTNCCAIAEIIGGASGVNLLPITGAVTPGGYLSFLEDELNDPESDVTCRTVYQAMA